MNSPNHHNKLSSRIPKLALKNADEPDIGIQSLKADMEHFFF